MFLGVSRLELGVQLQKMLRNKREELPAFCGVLRKTGLDKITELQTKPKTENHSPMKTHCTYSFQMC